MMRHPSLVAIAFIAAFCIIPSLATAQDAELRYDTDGFHADWFKPDDPNGRALILLGGAEGGNDFGNMMAPYFQSSGYHVLSVAYLNADGLPDQLENIPVEMVKLAIEWARSRPNNEITRIGLIGGSKGAELALISATAFQGIDALVLTSPSSFAWQSINELNWETAASSWTKNGEPLPFLKYDFSRGVERMYDFYKAAIDNLESSQAVIKVENVDCPVLILSGKQDRVWPSMLMARMITVRLEEHDFPHTLKHHNFEQAGHLLMHPAAFDNSAEWPAEATFEFTGGSPESFPQIATSSLRKIADFLDANL